MLAATAKTKVVPRPAHPEAALAKRQRSGESTSLARSHADGRAGTNHIELIPRLGPVSAPSVAGDSAESNTRKVLKEISTSLKVSHTAIRHCARLCHSACATFNEEAEAVSDARAQIGALLSVTPR